MNRFKVVDLETRQDVLLCSSHGTPHPSRLCLLCMSCDTFLMYGRQCRYPSRHIERCILLLPKIRAELCALLESMSYLETRSVNLESDTTLILRPTQPVGDIKVRELRQYIRIGE